MAPKSVSVTVRYSKPGTRPPVYLAGSFSNPAWQAAEMEYTSCTDNEFEFHKTVQVGEGQEYQYKFRIGEGEWWVLNEDSPSATDNAGNRNNLLIAPILKETVPGKTTATMTSEYSAPPTDVDTEDTRSTEERMGTREPSDVLFDDEIIKESEEPSIQPIHVQLPGVENLQPTTDQAETGKLKMKYLRMLDGAGQSSPETNQDLIAEESGTVSMGKEPRGEQSPSKLVASDTESTIKSEDLPSPERSRRTTPATETDDTANKEKESKERLAKGENLIPTMSIKEMDAQDIDSPGANSSEKDQGSEPGYIMVEDRALTPELAETAAEVADVAAKLDPRELTPPISDEEAGRIGYRRLSNTPIPRVAATAAEVADAAALLEEGEEDPLEAARRAFEATLTPEQRAWVTSGASTPEDEKVPLFPHELPPEFQDQIQQPRSRERTKSEASITNIPSSPYLEMGSNPDQLEPFPTTREGILEHLRLMQERLPEDEVNDDIAPAPSAVIFHRSEWDRSRRQSAVETEQSTLPDLPLEERFVALGASIDDRTNNPDADFQNASTLSDIKEESIIEHDQHYVPAITIEDMDSGADAANDFDESSKNKAEISEPLVFPRPEAAPVYPETPVESSDKQINDEEEIDEPESDADDSPKIKLIPATPAGSSLHTTDSLEHVDEMITDTGKSTGMDEGSSALRSRKKNASPAAERPLTSSSMRSAGKDARDRNFLKAFWRVVFVDWIGGFFARLRGGNKKETAIVVVGATLVVAAAMYLR